MPRNERAIPLGGADEPGSTPRRKTVQTHFWLTDADLDIFDTWEFQLRRSWRGANRSAFMRTLITLLRDADVELHGVTCEAELAMRIRTTLEGRDR